MNMKYLSADEEVPPGHGGSIHSLHQNDVLLPSSTNLNSHSGNIYFQKIVASLKNDYADPRLSEVERDGIVGQLVAHIRGMQPEGRFLREDGDRGCWVEVGDEGARVMVVDALRDCHRTEEEGEQREQLFESMGDDGATTGQLINYESSECRRHPDEWAAVAAGFERAPSTCQLICIRNESSSVNAQFAMHNDEGGMTQPLQDDLKMMAAKLSSTKNDLLRRLLKGNESPKLRNDYFCGQRHQLAVQLSDAHQNIEEDKRVYVELERLREKNNELRVQKERAESIVDVAMINQTIMNNKVRELNSAITRSKEVIASLTNKLQKFEQVEMIDSAAGVEQSKRSSIDEGDSAAKEEYSLKRQRTKSEGKDLSHSLSLQMVKLKEEADQRAAKMRMEADKRVASADENLEDANELLTQQIVATNTWQGRFDELFELASEAGVDRKKLSEIRYRPLPSRYQEIEGKKTRESSADEDDQDKGDSLDHAAYEGSSTRIGLG